MPILEKQTPFFTVRCFEDENIVHVDGKINPISDIETINTELILADLESVSKSLEKERKKSKSGDKESIKKVSLFESVLSHLDQGKLLRDMSLNPDDLKLLYPLFLITLKPVMYVANVNEGGFENNQHLENVIEYAKNHG